jgi:hypothetical protein
LPDLPPDAVLAAALQGSSRLRRPRALFADDAVHGLRGAQCRLVGGARLLDVYLHAATPPVALAVPGRWTLTGAPGAPPVGVSAAAVDGDHLRLTLGGTPGLARYRLSIVMPAPVPVDPLRSWLPVRLRPECPDSGACLPQPSAPSAPARSFVHDYTARDYAALRRALLELLLREDPSTELSPADPLVTLLELFAHLGDTLHYALDRVATEAYLPTARLRTSVRRHARLVDHQLRDGSAARTVVLVETAPDGGDVAARAGDLVSEAPGSPLAFTLERAVTARPAVGEVAVYGWGEDVSRLPAGATGCVLVRPLPADPGEPTAVAAPAPGELLLLEVVDAGDAAAHAAWASRQPGTRWPRPAGAAAFRDPLPGRPAQVVRLTEVEPFTDPLAQALHGRELPLWRVAWDRRDALERELPVSVDRSTGIPAVAVARLNCVPAHHGRLVAGPVLAPLPRPGASAADAVEHALIAAGSPARGGVPAGPGLALVGAGAPAPFTPGAPYRLDVTLSLPSASRAAEPVPVVASLLDGPAGGFAAVVDVEDELPPVLRLQTGGVGLAPPAGSVVTAAYEVGGGAVGNVPAGALTVLERLEAEAPRQPAAVEARWEPVPGVRVRNPVPAGGGRDPEPLDAARRDAPVAPSTDLLRAVLPADHAAAAATVPGVGRAAATSRWTGSWRRVTTAVDLGTVAEPDRPAVLAEVSAVLEERRMVGTEVAGVSGTPVGVALALDVLVVPGADVLAVRAAVLSALRPGHDSRPGVFHPSRTRMGSPVYVSAAVAAVARLPGVDAVTVMEARRLDDPPGRVSDVVRVAPHEVAVLDDDPARPDRGRLSVVARSAR